MELYTNPASPFCRKVEIVIHELGLSDHVRRTKAVGHPTDSSGMPVGINPLGKIPTLSREDGPALYDSRVICRFLDQAGDGRLYPEGRLWEVLTLEATADGIMDAAVLMVYETRSRPQEMRYAPWVDGQWAKIVRGLTALESRWMSHLTGPLNMGQIAVACALGYLDFRHPDRPWKPDHDALAKWFATFSERDSMKATFPEG